MSLPHSIPDELIPAVLAFYTTPNETGGARTLADVVTWLWDEHRVRTSRSSVCRMMNDYRRERADIMRAAVSEKLLPGITADLDALEEIRLAARDEWENKSDPKEKASFMALEVRVIESKLRFAGLDPANDSGNDGATVEEITAIMLAKRPPPIGFRSDVESEEKGKG